MLFSHHRRMCVFRSTFDGLYCLFVDLSNPIALVVTVYVDIYVYLYSCKI